MDNYLINYGTKNYLVDVTNILFQKFKYDNYLHLFNNLINLPNIINNVNTHFEIYKFNYISKKFKMVKRNNKFVKYGLVLKINNRTNLIFDLEKKNLVELFNLNKKCINFFTNNENVNNPSFKKKKCILCISCHTNNEHKFKSILSIISHFNNYVDKFLIINSLEFKNKIEYFLDDKNVNLNKLLFFYTNNDNYLCYSKYIYLYDNYNFENYDNIILTNDSYYIFKSVKPFINIIDKNIELISNIDSFQFKYHFQDYLRCFNKVGFNKIMNFYKKNIDIDNEIYKFYLVEKFEVNVLNLFSGNVLSLFNIPKNFVTSLEINNNLLEKFINIGFFSLKLKKITQTTIYQPDDLFLDFDKNIYKKINQDLHHLKDYELIIHFNKYGKNEGRLYKENQKIIIPKFLQSVVKEFNLKNYDSEKKKKLLFPKEFDLELYRLNNKDLNNLNDDDLYEHYKKKGCIEGRICSEVKNRKYLVSLIDTNIVKCLEISPADNPMLVGKQVKYFSILDKKEIKEWSLKHKRLFNNIQDINYFDENGNLGIINETFDLIFSSHVIEHVTDLILHLQNVSKLLNKDGYYLIYIPDKRYCFDNFKNESTIEDVLSMYYNKSNFHSIKPVILGHLYSTHNNAKLHWNNEHGKFNDKDYVKRLKDVINLYETETIKNKKYIDVHSLYLTPESFQKIIKILYEVEFIDLKIDRIYPTLKNTFEFYVVLKKT